jgi:hypothetical protein
MHSRVGILEVLRLGRRSCHAHRRAQVMVEQLERRTVPAAVRITGIPQYGVDGFITGSVTGVDFASYRIAPYIQIEGVGWWTKPTFSNPTVPINSDGTFVADVATGGIDSRATIFYAALIPAGVTPPQAAGAGRIPASLAPVASDSVERFGRTIQFAGLNWGVKEAPVGVGPGGNHFSNDPSDVFVDAVGLHLTLRAFGNNEENALFFRLPPHCFRTLLASTTAPGGQPK